MCGQKYADYSCGHARLIEKMRCVQRGDFHSTSGCPDLIQRRVDCPDLCPLCRETAQHEASSVDNERRSKAALAAWCENTGRPAEACEAARPHTPRGGLEAKSNPRGSVGSTNSPFGGLESTSTSLWRSSVALSDLSLSAVSTVPTSVGSGGVLEESTAGGTEAATPAAVTGIEIGNDEARYEVSAQDASDDETETENEVDFSGPDDDTGESVFEEESHVILYPAPELLPTLPSWETATAPIKKTVPTSFGPPENGHYRPFNPQAPLALDHRLLRDTVSTCSFVSAPLLADIDRFATPAATSVDHDGIYPGLAVAEKHPNIARGVPEDGQAPEIDTESEQPRQSRPPSIIISIEPPKGPCEVKGELPFPAVPLADDQDGPDIDPAMTSSHLRVPEARNTSPSLDNQWLSRVSSYRVLKKNDSLRLPSKENLRTLGIFPRWAKSSPEVHRDSEDVIPGDTDVSVPKTPSPTPELAGVLEEGSETFLAGAESTVAEVDFPISETQDAKSRMVIPRKPVSGQERRGEAVQRDDRRSLPSASCAAAPVALDEEARVRRTNYTHPRRRRRLSSAPRRSSEDPYPPSHMPTQKPNGASCAPVSMAEALASYRTAVPQAAILQHQPGTGALRSSRPGERPSSARDRSWSSGDDQAPLSTPRRGNEQRRARLDSRPRAEPTAVRRREEHPSRPSTSHREQRRENGPPALRGSLVSAQEKRLHLLLAVERVAANDRETFYAQKCRSTPDVRRTSDEDRAKKATRTVTWSGGVQDTPKTVSSVAQLFRADSIRGERQAVLVPAGTRPYEPKGL